MYCGFCGEKNNDGDYYCGSCGKMIAGKKSDCVDNNRECDKDNWLSILPFILGIIAFFLFWVPFSSIPMSILGILIGIFYKKKSSYKVAGFVVNGLSLVISVILACFVGFSFWLVDFVDENIEDVDYFKEEGNYFDINGSSWYGDDGSLLELDVTGSYSWYQDSKGSGDSYFLGDYVYYNGLEAIDYIADKLSDYGITKDEQLNFFEYGGYDFSDYYLIILSCDKMVIGGVEQENVFNQLYYYGFYDDNSKRLDLINMDTTNDAGFTLKVDNDFNRIDL